MQRACLICFAEMQLILFKDTIKKQQKIADKELPVSQINQNFAPQIY